MKKEVNVPALSVVEEAIVQKLVTNPSSQSVADSLGIPVEAVAQLRRKKGVKEWIAELKQARKEQLLTYATETLAATLKSKVDAINEDDERTLGNSTRKDHVEIAKTLIDSLKGQTSADEVANDPLARIYQQINVIQSKNDA